MNNASTTSFKDELEAEIRSADSSHRKKLLITIVALFLLAASCIIGTLLLIPTPVTEQALQSPPPPPDIPEPATQKNPATSDTALQVKTEAERDSSTSNTSYASPAPSQIDKAAFKAHSHQLLTHYSNIVELVSFPAGMSTSDKVTRTRQAYLLDKQYFSQTIELRAMVNSANPPPSEYMTAVEHAENGVSAISVGVDGLNRWAENPNGASSIDASLGSVKKGAVSLQQLSRVLGEL